jgi:hypothetical protein
LGLGQQALSRYAYALNNPLRYTDPNRHKTCKEGPGCGGVVINNSSHSVRAYGSWKDPSNPKSDADGFVRGWREVPPNTQSDQLKPPMYDVDVVSATDSAHPIGSWLDPQQSVYYRFDDQYGYQLSNVQVAEITDYAGGDQIMDVRPKNWWDWPMSVGSNIFGAIVGHPTGWYQCKTKHCNEDFVPGGPNPKT